MNKEVLNNKKVAIAFAVDNRKYFNFFKMAFKILLSRNKKYFKKYNNFSFYVFYIDYGKKDEKLEKDIKTFLKSFDYENIFFVKQGSIGRKIIEDGMKYDAIILRTFMPFQLDEDYLLFLDTDTFPNIDLFSFFNDCKTFLNNEDKIILRKKEKLHKLVYLYDYNNYIIENNIAFDKDIIFDNQIIQNEYGNGGIMLIKTAEYKEKFGNSEKIFVDKYKWLYDNSLEISKVNWRGRICLCDETFLAYNFYGYIDNGLDEKYNTHFFLPSKVIAKNINNDNFIIHFMMRPRELRDKIMDFDLSDFFYSEQFMEAFSELKRWEKNKISLKRNSNLILKKILVLKQQ